MDKPTLLEVFSYIFFTPTCIVGPSFEFSDFKKFIELKGEYKDLPKDLAIKSAIKEFSKAMICIFLFLAGGKICDIHYLITEKFNNHNYLSKVNSLFNLVLNL